MAKPITIPNTFASATSAIPLSQLDQDFSTLANSTNDLATYSNYVADTGAADAFIANYPANTNTSSLTTGLRLQFKAANANTGASTLNVQVNGASIGTASIRLTDGSALPANTIIAGALVDVMYDGTNFQIMNDPSGGQEIISNLTLSGNLTVAGTSTFTGNVTGNVVNTTTSTITNLTSSNVTITGGSIDNISITNLTSLTVDGNTTLGDASGDTLTITGTTVTTPNGLNFDSNTFVIDATNNRVGIGTASPSVTFETLEPNSAGIKTAARFGVTGNGGSGRGIGLMLASGGSTSSVDVAQIVGIQNTASATANNAFLTFQVANSSGTLTEVARFNNSGGLGINTTSINSSLASNAISLGGTSSASYEFIIGGNYQASLTATSSLLTNIFPLGGAWRVLQNGASEAMRIDSSGNVGIGTSSPSYAVDIRNATSTALRVGSSNNLFGSLLSWDNTAGNGKLWTLGAYDFVFGTNATERMRIDSSGSVGINAATNLRGNLEVRRASLSAFTGTSLGNIVVSDSAATADYFVPIDFAVIPTTGTPPIARIAAQRTGSGSYLYFGTSSNYSSGITNSAMVIDYVGNVGINVTSPVTRLDVNGIVTIRNNGGTFNTTPNTNYGLNFQAANSGVTYITSYSSGGSTDIAFATNSGGGAASERMRINSSGNISIGASSGNGKLSVQDSSAALQEIFTNSGTNYAALEVRNTGSSVYIGKDNSAGSFFGSGTAYASCVWSGGAYPLVFFTTGTERMRITSGGFTKMSNVGTYFGATGSYHEFRSDVAADATLVLTSTSGSFSANGIYHQIERNTTNNTFYAYSYYNGGAGAYKYRIADSGNVTNTNGSYGTISDVKNKENIVDATPKLEKLKQLQVRNFNFKGDDLKQIGFIAQEFEQVFPSMVEEHKDTDAEGNDLGTTTKSIKTSVLVPILVKAIQEQQAMIEELKQEVALLKSK